MADGLLIVLSAPSGCGKTTIAKAIRTRHPEILFSVSATTRPKRPGEVHGRDYFFLSRNEFEERQQNGDLVEWEEIYGNLYGTLKSEVSRVLQKHQVMLFDVDVKGALSIRRNFPEDSLLIFITPPSREVLMERLQNRKTEDPETLARRLQRVPMEMEQGIHFDVQIVNDVLETAIDDVDAVIQKRREKKLN